MNSDRIGLAALWRGRDSDQLPFDLAGRHAHQRSPWAGRAKLDKSAQNGMPTTLEDGKRPGADALPTDDYGHIDILSRMRRNHIRRR
jgi:hypothetical protein